MASTFPQEKNLSWIKGLDSLRFVLAGIVFLSHLNNPYHDLLVASPHFVLRLAGMLLGVLFSGVGSVMAFFIISGFVIHYPYKDKYPETVPFLVRRWVRIAAPLIVIALLAKMFNVFSVIPIWSLYCELIYYTLYPLLIRIKVDWIYKFLAAFLLSYVVIFLLAPGDRSSLLHRRNINYIGAYWQLGDYLTWIIGLPCWLLGVILAQQIDSVFRPVSPARAWLFRFAVLLSGILLDVLKFHFFVSYIFTMNVFALLLFFWIRNEILYFKERQPPRLLEFSGKFSYSLYLCHNVFVFFITMVLPLNIFTYFPIIMLVLLASYLFYLGVERPSHLLSRKLARQAGSWTLAIQAR